MPIFENRQWVVTDAGLAPIDGNYPTITAERLLEMDHRGLYDWLPHMANKSWVDLNAFVEAFKEALSAHVGKYPGDAFNA